MRGRVIALGLAAALGAAAAPAVAGAPGPRVETMIVGADGTVLKGPLDVVARGVRVRIGPRSCPAPPGTALAVLAAARRRGGPGFHVRDDGACGALYVDRIGRRAARGLAGWQYKVGPRAGTNGAGDPAGPFGTGKRIRSGARVVWYWCRLSGAGCQRTLAVTPAARDVARGAPLAVRVRSYDDRGRARDVRGATVRLGRAAARTDGAGRATVPAPARAGTWSVRATKAGLVVAFPERVRVR